MEENLPSRFGEILMEGRWKSPLGRNRVESAGVGKKRMRVTVKKPDPTRHIYVGLSWSGLSGHGVRTIRLPLKMCRCACERMIWDQNLMKI